MRSMVMESHPQRVPTWLHVRSLRIHFFPQLKMTRLLRCKSESRNRKSNSNQFTARWSETLPPAWVNRRTQSTRSGDILSTVSTLASPLRVQYLRTCRTRCHRTNRQHSPNHLLSHHRPSTLHHHHRFHHRCHHRRSVPHPSHHRREILVHCHRLRVLRRVGRVVTISISPVPVVELLRLVCDTRTVRSGISWMIQPVVRSLRVFHRSHPHHRRAASPRCHRHQHR